MIIDVYYIYIYRYMLITLIQYCRALPPNCVYFILFMKYSIGLQTHFVYISTWLCFINMQLVLYLPFSFYQFPSTEKKTQNIYSPLTKADAWTPTFGCSGPPAVWGDPSILHQLRNMDPPCRHGVCSLVVLEEFCYQVFVWCSRKIISFRTMMLKTCFFYGLGVILVKCHKRFWTCCWFFVLM